MASTKKSLTARVVAGVGAAAIATLTVLGAALPASAAGPNLDPNDTGTLTIHKFDQPAIPGTAGDGSALTADPADANRLDGVEFTLYRVDGISLETNAGWTDFYELDPATIAENDLTLVNSDTTGENGNAKGTVTFSNLELGVYLVRETNLGNNNIAIPAPDFLVTMPVPSANNTWNYEVNVYPKNPVGYISKSVVEGDARVLNQDVSWELSGFVPYTHGDYKITGYQIVDTYDERLTVDLSSVEVELNDALLAEGTYKVTHDAENRTVTVDILDLVALNAADGQSVQVTLTTKVTGTGSPASIGDGVIDNDATLIVNDNTVDSAEDITYWGALRVVKHAEGDDTAMLSGARFDIRTDADDAATTIASRVTNSEGVLDFPGIITNVDGEVYWLVETEAPLGYEPMAAPRQITIESGQPVVDGRNYQEVASAQVDGYMLPVTGGSGQAAFMIGGFGLLAGALGFMLMRRLKAKAEAEAQV